MSDTDETKRPAKTLSLKKTETSTVKQSFSHGRTKAVVVEKKRSAAPPAAVAKPAKAAAEKPAAAAAPAPVAPAAAPATEHVFKEVTELLVIETAVTGVTVATSGATEFETCCFFQQIIIFIISPVGMIR